ncbi:MAG TPA: ATP-dependent Clp protease proteolytic subunit, partial [Candidatus Cloacimonadota bacterium]|nr:ATP-dependent Clp protease proteolytic subunit [Candidatus Cloacimonadota bacterium]
TGQPMEKIIEDTDRNYFMSAQEAQNYGIIDEVITHRK